MPVETIAHVRGDDLSADQRWAAWVAKGVEHDRKGRKHALVVAVALAAGAAVAAGAVLFQLV